MQIPARIPGLKLLTILLVGYTAVWISLEGALWRVILMGILVTTVSLAHIAQKSLAGRSLSWAKWLALTVIAGLFLGLGSGGLTILLMGVKTGLHAHGPEFTVAEIGWVVGRIPLWGAAGLFAGLGVGIGTWKA